VNRREALASRSWTHLQHARELVRTELADRLDDRSLIESIPTVASAVRSAADELPKRLTDGNLGAALAGHVVGNQHAHPDLDCESLLRQVLDAAGGLTPAVIEVCHVRTDAGNVVYYRRLNCCLRDRVTDRHRCDTCSLRPRHELDDIVTRAIAPRLSSSRPPDHA